MDWAWSDVDRLTEPAWDVCDPCWVHWVERSAGHAPDAWSVTLECSWNMAWRKPRTPAHFITAATSDARLTASIISSALITYSLAANVILIVAIVTNCHSNGNDSPHRRRRTDHSMAFARCRQCAPPDYCSLDPHESASPKWHLHRFIRFARLIGVRNRHVCSNRPHLCTAYRRLRPMTVRYIFSRIWTC